MELPRLGPARRLDGRHVRRQPGVSGPPRAVARGRRDPARRTSARARRTSWPAGRPGLDPGASSTSARCAVSDRPARRCRRRASEWVHDAVSPTIAARLAQRRHGPVHRVPRARRRSCRSGPARSAAGCSGARVEAFDEGGQPVIGREGELVITAPMPSMPVGVLERPRRLAAARGVLLDLPRRLAPRRLADDHRARLVHRHRAVATRRSSAAACGSARRSSTASSRALPEIADSLVVHLEDPERRSRRAAAVRRAARRAPRSTTGSRGRIRRGAPG